MVARRPPSDSADPSREDAQRDALAERRAEVEELRQRLAGMKTAGGDFLAASAHAIRGPLTLTLSYLEILVTDLSEGLSEEQRSFLGIAHDNAVRLRRLVDDLVDLAALETGTARIDAAPAAVADIIAAVVRGFEPIAEQKGLEIAVDVADGLPTVAVDRSRLEDTLRRLLDNAIRFTPVGGTVRLHARPEEARLVIEVRDSGAGMPAERVPEAMQPFVQLHLSPGESREGYGLGLPLCRRAVEAFGGSFDLVSSEGEGTTVTIILPVNTP